MSASPDAETRGRGARMPVPRKRVFAVDKERIRALREMRGWSQREAADMLGMTERQWRRIETGEHPMKVAYWSVLCAKAGVPEDWQPPVTDPTPE
jgi:ribosome-binding protein aMBF1 (putative translation factor)